ncbi:MAG: carbon-nitrogen hydrolase family protein [Alphaproteobacteria bacterium]|nr:carbon-nitrogen hydrolase family protein [Alphaproteobacteria bacterium]
MTKVSVIQASSVFGDIEKTIAKIDQLTAEAAAQGSKLVVFPEAMLGGYPLGINFGEIGKRGSDTRRRFHDYTAAALRLPGDIVQAVSTIAKNHSLVMVIGMVEREIASVYNSALVIGADGKVMRLHRALTVPPSERALWRLGDGAYLKATGTPIGNIGTMIRTENYMPAARMIMYGEEVQIYCALTLEDDAGWIPSMQHIAREGGCFVLSSCQYLTRQDYPAGWFENEGDAEQVFIRGGSCIVSPSGTVIEGPLYGKEGILTADIDLGEIIDRKVDFDAIGDAARPDVFRLMFNYEPLDAIISAR